MNSSHGVGSGLATPDSIMQLGIGFYAWRTLQSALELEVFSVLSRGPMAGDDLRDKIGLDARVSRDFFDALVGLGVLERDGRVYRNSPAAERFLDTSQPTSLHRFLRNADQHWGRLTELLRTGANVHGGQGDSGMFVEENAKKKAAWRTLMVGMDALTYSLRMELTHKHDWTQYGTVVDVGGARGSVAAAIAGAAPDTEVLVFDLPQVEPYFDELVAELGTADQVSFQAGNFFENELPEADAILFGHVLHDWAPEQRRELLKSAFRALRPGGEVLVYDQMIGDDRKGPLDSLLVSLNMAVRTPGGSEYTEAELREWMDEAGFQGVTASGIAGTDVLVIGRKPA